MHSRLWSLDYDTFNSIFLGHKNDWLMMMDQSHSSMDCLPAVVEDSEHHFRCKVMLTVRSLILDEKQMRRGCNIR